MQSDPRLIAALDFPTAEAAKQAVEEIGDAVSYYKVGMELYYAAGNDMIRFLKERGKHVFLDLKLQDIPNTVASALKVETQLGVDMINVHAVGGKKMMEEAAKAVREKAAELGMERPKLIAVTILTSMDEEQFADLNYKNTIAEQVVALAKLAKAAGLDGVVASPKEAAEMVMIYSNAAFDELAELSSNERMQKMQAFICHTERIMGAEEGILQEPIMRIFQKQA